MLNQLYAKAVRDDYYVGGLVPSDKLLTHIVLRFSFVNKDFFDRDICNVILICTHMNEGWFFVSLYCCAFGL